MIYNNYFSMNYIVEHKDEDITLEGLLHIHKLMCKATLDEASAEGRLRRDDNIAVVDTIKGETVYDPPELTEVENLLQDLFVFFNTDDAVFIHPIIKACIIHFMVAWIHPFVDGNGRTARALFYWYMLKKGYWLTEYLTISSIIKGTKNQYEKAFLYTELDEYDVTYFLTYLVQSMMGAVENLKTYISKKQTEVSQANIYLKIPKVNERMAQVIKLVSDDPEKSFKIKELENRFNISTPTAAKILNTLVDLGLLEVVRVDKKSKLYVRANSFEQVLKDLMSHK